MEQQPRLHSRKHKTQPAPGCAGTLVYFVFIVGISLILSVVAAFTINDICAFVKDDIDISFTVSEPVKLSKLSRSLDKEHVVNYGSVFRMYVMLGGHNTQISAGTYTLNPSMDYGQIVRTLNRTLETGNEITVTIPEGYTNAQIRDLLIEKHVCSEADIDKALNEYSFKHTFLADQLPPSENWLEGYLFPDTYSFSENSSAVRGIVNRMLNNFDAKYDDKIKEGQEKLGLTEREVVIVASMLEREAKLDNEYAKVAGVIYNRLNNSSSFPYLQIDATVQYAVGHKNALTSEDLQIDSPYNTYKYKRLPAGPICNPGYTALYAATHPESHKYYYYVALPDGSHIFSRTADEHAAAIKKAQRAFAEQQ